MQPIITKKSYKDDPKTGTNTTYSPQKNTCIKTLKKKHFQGSMLWQVNFEKPIQYKLKI